MKKFKFEVAMVKRCSVTIELERPESWNPEDFEKDMDTGVYRIDSSKPGTIDNIKKHDDKYDLEFEADAAIGDWQIDFVDYIDDEEE
jgi:hypothetical protein